MHLRQQHVLLQPRRLSRAAGKLCRKHAWNARSKQRHVPDAKQVLLWKGWVLKQMLNDVSSRVGATATRARVESPLHTELFVDACSVRHQGNCARAHAKSPPLGSPSAHKAQRYVHATRRRYARTPQAHLDLSEREETCSGEKAAAFSRREHTWISFRAQTNMFMRQHAATFARCEQTWISLRVQRDMFRRKGCCVLTPRAHLDLFPCANRHVPAKRLLRSDAADMFHRKDCRDHALPPKVDDFYLRAPYPASTVKCAHVPYAIGNVTRNPSHRAFVLQVVDPISVYVVGE